MQLKKYTLLVLSSLLLLTSCSEAEQEQSDLTINETETLSETSNSETEQTPPAPVSNEIIWGIYEGILGIYQKHVVLELNIDGTDVSGNYFYAKHQKSLQIDGTFDPATGLIQATESYKGQKTGYLEFTITKGEIEGHWAIEKGADREQIFEAHLMDIQKEDFSIKHERYENNHETSIYNADSEDDVLEVTDVLTINRVGGQFFSFFYSTVGANGHTGSLEGLGEIKNGKYLFSDDKQCQLTFTFSNSEVKVEETGDCSDYKGARGYFENTLTKVR